MKQINEAVEKLESIEKSLDSWSSDPKNYNTEIASCLERIAWDISAQSNNLKEISRLLGI